MVTQEESLGFLLANVARLMRRAFNASLERSPSTLNLAQARALFYLSRNEDIRQVDLADLLEIQPITLARLVDQLAAMGLVERRADPDDRRAYRLHLTAKAEPELTIIKGVASAIREQSLNGLDGQQASLVQMALRQMHQNLSAR